jgi:hypothetical protein
MSKYGLVWLAVMLVLAFIVLSREGSFDRVRLMELASGLSFLIPLILVPALCILLGMEVLGYVKQRNRRSLGMVVWRILRGSWLLVAASLLLVYGMAYVAGGIERLLRMKGMWDLGGGLATLVTGLLFSGVACLLGWLAFRRKKDPAEAREHALAEERRRSWEQLDFISLEERLRCTLPAAYKAMMQPGSEWRQESWTLHPHRAAWFNVTALIPPCMNALRKFPPTGETALCFATGDDFEYWLRPGDEDPPVYAKFADDAGENIEEIAPNLSVFLGWRRTEYK